jgi:TetR/AcrR family transcriptional repressor of lmrAB and yxaGH operons
MTSSIERGRDPRAAYDWPSRSTAGKEPDVADGARDRMVDSAIKLLATRGFQGASFSSVLEDSKAPRGSIYHHFPGGKDELILEAIDRSGRNATRLVEGFRGRSAADVVGSFVAVWRALLRMSDFRVGCSVLGATVSAGDEGIVERAAGVFRAWQEQLGSVLVEAGVAPDEADELGTLLVAACEGAVVLCRAERSFTPLDRVERSLRRLAEISTAP